MINKAFLNDEFLKSIDTNYKFSNKPIKRFEIPEEPAQIKLKLEKLMNKIDEIKDCDLKKKR